MKLSFFEGKHTKRRKNRHSVGYLGKAKVRNLFFVSLAGSLMTVLSDATDALIVANLIGPDAVAGTVLVAPFFTFGMIFEILVSTGAAVLYTRAVADYDSKMAREILGMSGAIALIFGALLSVAAFTGQNLFFDLMGAEGVVREYGEKYFYFYRFTFLINPLTSLLTEIVYIDGDEITSTASEAVVFIGNAVFSIILVHYMGILGASLGSAIGLVMSFLLLVSHFFRKKYRVKPVVIFRMSDIKEILIIGGTDAINIGCDCLYSLLINAFIVHMFGAGYLVLLAIATMIYDLMSLGEGVSESMKTMLLSYHSDSNIDAMKNLLKFGIRVLLIIGSVFIAVIFFLAPIFPRMYDIADPDLAQKAVVACRLCSLSCIPCILLSIFSEYYTNIGKYRITVLSNTLDSIVVRIILNTSLGLLLGINGIWLGEALCTYVTLALSSIYVIRKYGKDDFPFLIGDNASASQNFNFRITELDAVRVRDEVNDFLQDQSVPGKIRNMVMLLFEDISMLILDVNKDADDVNADVFVNCRDEAVNVVIWYDGEEVNLSDEDMLPTGIRTYLVASLMGRFYDKKYQPTAGYNRMSFMVPYNMSSSTFSPS